MKKHPVHKIVKTTIDLESGEKLIVLHQLSDQDFKWCFDRWSMSATKFTSEDLCEFVKMFFPNTMCVTEPDYNRITKGKSIPATEAEYLAENPYQK